MSPRLRNASLTIGPRGPLRSSLVAALSLLHLGSGSPTAWAGPPASGGESGGEERVGRAARREADRAFLRGEEPGSIRRPALLQTKAEAAALCKAVERPPRGSAEEGEELPPRREVARARREALRNVYEVTVPPAGFRFAKGGREGVLPLDVQRALLAVDGAVSLQVMRRQGARFTVPADRERALREQHAKKELALRVVFRVDREGANEVDPCFSYPKSDAYSLRIEPLRYELRALRGADPLPVATATTPALEELEHFASPGEGVLATAVVVEGSHDAEAVARAIDGGRALFEGCLDSVLRSAGATGTLAYGATVSAEGVVQDVTLELEALDAPGAAACVERVLAAIAAPRGPRPSRLHVTVGIDRERHAAAGGEPEVIAN